MTRRAFLSALSALMAATAIDPATLVPVLAKPARWASFKVGAWHFVEYRVAAGRAWARIDGQDVTDNAQAVADIARFMYVDTEAQAIRFGATGLARQSVFLWRPADQLPEAFNLGFSLRVNDDSSAMPLAQLGDLYVTDAPRVTDWQTDALGYGRTTSDEIQLERGYESVRIEAVKTRAEV